MTENTEAQLQARLARAKDNNRICSRVRAALQRMQVITHAMVTITRYTVDGCPTQITVRYSGTVTPGQLFDALNSARLRPAGCDIVCVQEES